MPNYGRAYKRGGYSRRYSADNGNVHGDPSDDGCSQNNETRRGGHPPGLKGKAIGLYYRDQARKKKLNGEKPSSSNFQDPRYFSIDAETEYTVKNLLKHSCRQNDSVFMNDNRLMLTSGNQDDENICENQMDTDKSQFENKFRDTVFGSIQDKLAESMLSTPVFERNDSLDEQLKAEHRDRVISSKYLNMMKFRSKLPSFNMKDEILDIINGNQVVVISGETGCGKTTQIPQFLLDDAIERNRGSVTKIVCTQPRRISAISVAERVATERGEALGKSVGYQIRLEKILCRNYGSILFCTTGLLLQFMQGDPALRDFSHIILDEIHERNTESDLIITLLKQVIPRRPDLKIILMSATLNAGVFSKYYENCPNIHIPGFTYPVTEYYLEDIIKITNYEFSSQIRPQDNYKKFSYLSKHFQKTNGFSEFIEPALRDMAAKNVYPLPVINELRNPNSEVLSLDLIQKLLEYICLCKGPGAILIFLPGLLDIINLIKNLRNSRNFPSHKCEIYPLHSRLPTVEQKLVFEPSPPGVRKIIVATSIAETSITIEDVVFVIDCGRTKLARFDVLKNVETLEPEWISLANGKQRRGRAGRVQPGECFRLYTRAREMTFEQYPTPEMLRTPLEKVILQTKILRLGRVDAFLSKVLDPPTNEAIVLSLKLLRTLNAIDHDENLTPLGYHLALLPLDPRTGKMIIWAAIFSCIEPVFSIAASLSFKSAFCSPLGKEEEADKAKLELGLGEFSDHIALAEALRQFEQAYSPRDAHRFCHEYFLSWNTLKLLIEMKQQFAKHLYQMQFLDSDDPSDDRSNRNSHNLALIKAIVCAGLYPNIAVIKPSKSKIRHFQTADGETVKIHPSSINHKRVELSSPYVTYYLKQKSTAIFLHDTTCVSEVAIIFAGCNSSIKSDGTRSLITLQDSLTFRCRQSSANIIQRLCKEFDKIFERKITQPGTIDWECVEGDVLRAIISLISESDPSALSY